MVLTCDFVDIHLSFKAGNLFFDNANSLAIRTVLTNRAPYIVAKQGVNKTLVRVHANFVQTATLSNAMQFTTIMAISIGKLSSLDVDLTTGVCRCLKNITVDTAARMIIVVAYIEEITNSGSLFHSTCNTGNCSHSEVKQKKC